MTAIVHSPPGESNCSAHRGAGSLSWGSLFREIFPNKTAANVAALARTGVRAAEYVVAGESEPSAHALINLLRSPVGQRVLDAITADCDWRAAERRLIEIQGHKSEIEKIEQEIRALDRVVSPRR